ncbi:MAG: response regulator [Bacteroidota bacterium]
MNETDVRRAELFRPGRIWILEDDADIGFVLEYFLNEEGFETKLFPSAVGFRQAVGLGLPDLFLMDVMLPDGNGVDLCSELKQD